MSAVPAPTPNTRSLSFTGLPLREHWRPQDQHRVAQSRSGRAYLLRRSSRQPASQTQVSIYRRRDRGARGRCPARERPAPDRRDCGPQKYLKSKHAPPEVAEDLDAFCKEGRGLESDSREDRGAIGRVTPRPTEPRRGQHAGVCVADNRE